MSAISIFTPSFNKPQYVAEAINSVLNQTCPDFEYWIIDNSTDEITREKLRPLVKTDKRINYIELDFTEEVRAKNYVTSLILNEFYPKANGKYIFYLSDDDLLDAECFEKCMQFFQDKPEASVGYFSMKVTEETDPGVFKDLSEIKATNQKGYNTNDPQVDCTIDGGQVVHKALCLHEVKQPYFPTAMNHDTSHVDGMFLEQLARKYTFYPIKEYLVEHRRTHLSAFTRPGL